MKKLLLLSLLMASCSALANTADQCVEKVFSSKLSADQKLVLAEQCKSAASEAVASASAVVDQAGQVVETADKVITKVSDAAPQVVEKADKVITNVSEAVPQVVEKAGEISYTVAQTIKLVAKELNVAANEFVKTPVGLFVAALVTLHFAGDYAQHTIMFIWDVIMGLFIIVLSTFVCYLARKRILTGQPKEIKYINIFGKERIKLVKNRLTFDALKLEGTPDTEINNLMGIVALSYLIQVVGIIVGINFMVPG